ncbi:PLP-dependent aminotransferase family protein [Acidobacteria bacterium AB60]|nr:PLP-dependent aminotransferase family protein [Acidobacteria bacterium AB60]
MSKVASSFELSLNPRSRGQSLSRWLYEELRAAILEGRLKAGTTLPATREFARQQRISRGTVLSAFERLQDEGYLSSRVGIGTWVNPNVAATGIARCAPSAVPAYIDRAISGYKHPKPFVNWVALRGTRPFKMRDPALDAFPAELWGRLASRRARSFNAWVREEDDGGGYRPLREAIAHYLGSSRGVNCGPDQIVIVSGVQQALDLLARFLLKPGDPVWMEDPGYFGATIAFQRAGARIVPVPVDDEGLSIVAGVKACAHPRGVFVTPAHQYPLGMTMSLDRRVELLRWAARTGAFILEDDYDSEYRFEGLPSPALQGLDRNGNVIFIGTFTKLLFPALRLGYIVLPPPLVEVFSAFRRGTDLRSSGMDQAVLCDFIAEGHFARHLRRMRSLYAARLEALKDSGRRYLSGVLEVSEINAGLYTAAFLRNGMTSRQAETIAAKHGIETRALDRFTLARPDPRGLLLGFAAFDEKAIRNGAMRLAAALSKR